MKIYTPEQYAEAAKSTETNRDGMLLPVALTKAAKTPMVSELLDTLAELAEASLYASLLTAFGRGVEVGQLVTDMYGNNTTDATPIPANAMEQYRAASKVAIEQAADVDTMNKLALDLIPALDDSNVEMYLVQLSMMCIANPERSVLTSVAFGVLMGKAMAATDKAKSEQTELYRMLNLDGGK